MNDEMVKLEKVKKTCKISKIICKIVACIVTVGFVLSIVGAMVPGVIGRDKINSTISESIDNNQASFDVDDINIDGILQLNIKLDTLAKQGNYADVITVACIYATVVTGAVAVVFWMLVNIFKKITESSTPFSTDILQRMKTIFFIVTIIAFIANGLGDGLIVGCIGWSLYAIFDYGFVIQQVVDETI